jgi:hypothetical protein
MSISGIQGTLSPYQLGAAGSPMQQQLQQLSQALQSGNLSAAQSDFATLRQAFSQPSTTSGAASGAPSSPTANPVNQAFNQLASDLQSGNLSAAQKDLSTVQQDMQSVHGTISFPRFSPNQHNGGGLSTGQNSLLQSLNQSGQSLSSGNLANAQQTYATLQQQLQQFAFGGTALIAESPVSFDA